MITPFNAKNGYLHPPVLAYKTAFDWCAREISQPETVLLSASAPFYAREIVRRLPGALILRIRGGWGENPDHIRAMLGPEPRWDLIKIECPTQDGIESTDSIVWAMAEEPGWRDELAALTQRASRSAKLIVLAKSGKWKPLLSGAGESIGRSADLNAVATALNTYGWRTRTIHGFQGPLSILIGTTIRLPALLSRDDVIDRWLAEVREQHVVGRRQAGWSPLWAISAEREITK